MTSNFERLKHQVSDGSLRIIHIEAIPRSISTALGRALNEVGNRTVFVSEPFNRMKHDIEAAAGHILEVTDKISKSKEDPLTVITKNMARNLTLDIFRQWMTICDGVVWSIRDPRIQIASLVTRIANDLAYEPGADRIKQEDLTANNIKAVSDFLEDGPVSKNFSKTSWADIGEHFRSGYQPEQSVVVDGGDLTENPEAVLKEACNVLNLKYSSSMIEGWQGEFINVNTGYNAKLTDETHAWTREAAQSTGVMKASREPIPMDKLTPALRTHIMDVAMPIYKEMTGKNT